MVKPIILDILVRTFEKASHLRNDERDMLLLELCKAVVKIQADVDECVELLSGGINASEV